MGLRERNKCLDCQESDDNEHAFCICDVKHFILTQTNMQIDMNEQTTPFGLTPSDLEESDKGNKINHILMIAKLTIFKYKYGKVKNLRIIFGSKLRKLI